MLEVERVNPLSGTVAAGSAVMVVGGGVAGVDVAGDSFRDLDLNENFDFGTFLDFSVAITSESCFSCYYKSQVNEGLLLGNGVGHKLVGTTRCGYTKRSV